MAGKKLSNKTKTIKVSFCLPEGMWKKISSLSKRTEDSNARIVRKAIEEYLYRTSVED